jgi:hypothetical protein
MEPSPPPPLNSTSSIVNSTCLNVEWGLEMTILVICAARLALILSDAHRIACGPLEGNKGPRSTTRDRTFAVIDYVSGVAFVMSVVSQVTIGRGLGEQIYAGPQYQFTIFGAVLLCVAVGSSRYFASSPVITILISGAILLVGTTGWPYWLVLLQLGICGLLLSFYIGPPVNSKILNHAFIQSYLAVYFAASLTWHTYSCENYRYRELVDGEGTMVPSDLLIVCRAQCPSQYMEWEWGAQSIHTGYTSAYYQFLTLIVVMMVIISKHTNNNIAHLTHIRGHHRLDSGNDDAKRTTATATSAIVMTPTQKKPEPPTDLEAPLQTVVLASSSEAE